MHYYYRYYFKTESVEYDIRFEGSLSVCVCDVCVLCRDKNLFIQFLNRFLFRSSCAYVKCFPWSIASSNIRAIYNIHFCSALLCLALIFTQHHAHTPKYTSNDGPAAQYPNYVANVLCRTFALNLIKCSHF